MALPTFTKIAAPQDQMFVLPNGGINPAWHRFLLALPDLITKTGEAATTLNSTIDENNVALSARVTALEDNLGQPAVTDASTATLTIGATYSQAEIQALEANNRAQATTINTLIARLEAAGILEA